MGGKPRPKYQREVINAGKTTSWIWMISLDCGHVITLIDPKNNSKFPPDRAYCQPCVQRDRDIIYHRDELARLEESFQ